MAAPYHGDHQPRPTSTEQAGNKIQPIRPRAVVAPLHRGEVRRQYECTATKPVERRYEPVLERQGVVAEHGVPHKYPGNDIHMCESSLMFLLHNIIQQDNITTKFKFDDVVNVSKCLSLHTFASYLSYQMK